MAEGWTSNLLDVNHAVRQFQAGIDPAKNFSRICDYYEGWIRSYFARRITSKEDCSDLTQETLLKVYKGLDGFRGQAQFKTWLFRITETTYQRWYRQVRRHGEEIPLSTEQPEGPQASTTTAETQYDELERKEQRKELRKALEELPKKMRKCLILSLYHGLKQREIADFLGLSTNTVGVHLHQAQKRLRKSLIDRFKDVDL